MADRVVQEDFFGLRPCHAVFQLRLAPVAGVPLEPGQAAYDHLHGQSIARGLYGIKMYATTTRLPRHQLVVGALGDAVPGADQRLELRVRRVNLRCHGALCGLSLENLGR